MLKFWKRKLFTKEDFELPEKLELVKYPHKALTTPSLEPVDLNNNTYFGMVADRLKELMLSYDGSQKVKWLGVGMSACQVGINRPFFVMTTGKKDRSEVWYCFNPKITGHGKDTETIKEGCLSCPDAFVPVKRWRIIDVEYQELDGALIKTTLKGWAARIFQHEMDHINGVLCTQKKLINRANLNDTHICNRTRA